MLKKSLGIQIKSAKEIMLIRKASAITAQILDEVEEMILPGVMTEEINTFVHRRTIELDAIPAPLNYKGFPKSVCISPNNVICHGIPSTDVVLKSGDIVNIDVTSIFNGYFGDASRMYFVGGRQACPQEAATLVDVTSVALETGIRAVKAGRSVSVIGNAIQNYIDTLSHKYGIVREYTGHGIGRAFHEPPSIFHFRSSNSGTIMKEGMVFTIEPMINYGCPDTVLSTEDNWTVFTADGSLSAQWEHTVLVTKTGCEVLTNSPRSQRE